MPNFVPSIVIDQVIDALKAFLQPFVGDAEIVRGQTNRVPQPLGANVVLTELHSIPLETPTSITTGDAELSITGPAQIDIQADFYGPDSGDQCGLIVNIFRSVYACAQFPKNIQPLFCSNGNQSPLVTGEEQYEARWTLTASLQYNPIVTLPQQTANKLAVTVKEI